MAGSGFIINYYVKLIEINKVIALYFFDIEYIKERIIFQTVSLL